jgi:hypothetical protein
VKISDVYICVHRYDLRFAQICIQSIRHWYPDINITLVKNYYSGAFSVKYLQKYFGVKVLDRKGKSYGVCFGKLEPLFLPEKKKFILVDTDTVFVGKVIDYLNAVEADFVVDKEEQEETEVKRLYFDSRAVKNKFPAFPDNFFCFNAGQWMGTSGVLSKQSFSDVLVWDEQDQPRLRYPDIISMYDQGAFNYLLNVENSRGTLKVERAPLMIWPGNGKAANISLEEIKSRTSGTVGIVHWAGLKKKRMEDMTRSDILMYYEQEFYRKLPFGARIYNKILLKYLNMEFKFLHFLGLTKKEKNDRPQPAVVSAV